MNANISMLFKKSDLNTYRPISAIRRQYLSGEKSTYQRAIGHQKNRSSEKAQEAKKRRSVFDSVWPRMGCGSSSSWLRVPKFMIKFLWCFLSNGSFVRFYSDRMSNYMSYSSRYRINNIWSTYSVLFADDLVYRHKIKKISKKDLDFSSSAVKSKSLFKVQEKYDFSRLRLLACPTHGETLRIGSVFDVWRLLPSKCNYISKSGYFQTFLIIILRIIGTINTD